MKTLLTITPDDVSEDRHLQPQDFSNYNKRTAARAVLVNDQNQVYLLHVRNHGYHKLPGGGVQSGEDIHTALERELLEEVGCSAEIFAEIGQIIEYRDYEGGDLKQTSICFLAKQVGLLTAPQLEPDEIADGMITVIAQDLDSAINLLQSDKPKNSEGLSIQKRDLCFLETAKAILIAS